MNNQKLLRQLSNIDTDYDFYHSVLIQAQTDPANAVLLEQMKSNSKEITRLFQENIKLLSRICTPPIQTILKKQ